MERILLNKKNSKSQLNKDSYISLNFCNKKRKIPVTSIESILNLNEQYEAERMNCNTIRLVCTINPICSNVLFNNKSEFIVNEGSDNPISSSYYDFLVSGDNKKYLAESLLLGVDNCIDKTYTPLKLTQDTQLTRYDNIASYCGLDIFNNHLIRKETYKSINLPKTNNDAPELDNFNTIRDYLRNYHGEVTSGYSDVITQEYTQLQLLNNSLLHTYLTDDILSFKNAVNDKLIEENGWLGFTNRASIPSYDNDDNVVNINKPINNKNACEFIDMYPKRELFYFTPIYNQYRHRIEKNWEYCLTYPYSSTTNVSFINTVNGLNALKIAMYDDNTINSNGIESILIISVCKHGLKVSDVINVYQTSSITKSDKTISKFNIKCIDGTIVNEIVDDYSFYVTKNGNNLNDVEKKHGNWVSLDSDELDDYTTTGTYVYTKDKSKFFPLINDKVNLYDSYMNFSFKKVVQSVECEYYVRLFTRLPNWTFRKEKPTDYELYKSDSDLIQRFQQLEYDFESHIGQVGYARNIYNDEISEIVFTDDIDISNLKDNLGRPLTSIYLTIIKNNRGYKDWYLNMSTGEIEIFSSNPTLPDDDSLKNNESIEYSHCFGKVTNAFQLSYRSLINYDYNNVIRITNVDDDEDNMVMYRKRCSSGLNYSAINDSVKRENSTSDDDEVLYKYFNRKSNKNNLSGDVSFYGDIVCFSPYDYLETSIEMSSFRFNTAQREGQYGSTYEDRVGKKIQYDEILFDDYDFNLNKYNGPDNVTKKNKSKEDLKCFSAVTKVGFSGLDSENSLRRKEGYYYQAHYEIPIHEFDEEVTTQSPKFYVPQQIIKKTDGDNEKCFIIKTLNKTYLVEGDKINLYNTTLSDVNHISTGYITEDDKYVQLTVYKVKNRNLIYLTCDDKNYQKMISIYQLDDEGQDRTFYKDKFKMFKPDDTIPSYAYLIKDKTFKYAWRDVVHNGTTVKSTLESYPFTNNALYVNKFINFYLKRQDPNNYLKDYSWDGYTLHSLEYPYDMTLKTQDIDDENNYYEESDIVC